MESVKLANQHNKVIVHKVHEEGLEAALHIFALRTCGTSAAKGEAQLLLNEQRVDLCVPVEQDVEHDDFLPLKLSTGDVLEVLITGSASSDLEFVLYNPSKEHLEPPPPVGEPEPQPMAEEPEPQKAEWVDPELNEVEATKEVANAEVGQ